MSRKAHQFIDEIIEPELKKREREKKEKERMKREAARRVVREENERMIDFYLSEDCIDIELYTSIINAILYATNYFFGEMKEKLSNHGYDKKKLKNMLDNALNVYPPIYKFIITSKIMAHNAINDDDELGNNMVEICNKIMQPTKERRMKLNEGEKLRKETQCGCDTCKKFCNEGCLFTMNCDDFDREWTSKFYTCMGYQKKEENQ